MGFTPLSQGQARPPRDDNDTDYLSPSQMVGHLLLVWPVRYERDTYTKYPRQDGRPADAVFCDVVDLSVNADNGQPGKLMRGCKWSQGRLIRDTKGAVGCADPMLVQMGKDGDAYIIVDQSMNPASVQWGEWWLKSNPTFQPGINQPVSIKQQETAAAAPNGGGVWPPVSGPPSVPAAPVETAEESAMDRLRRQAAAANPYVPSSQPSLPPPPPLPEETPPF